MRYSTGASRPAQHKGCFVKLWRQYIKHSESPKTRVDVETQTCCGRRCTFIRPAGIRALELARRTTYRRRCSMLEAVLAASETTCRLDVGKQQIVELNWIETPIQISSRGTHWSSYTCVDWWLEDGVRLLPTRGDWPRRERIHCRAVCSVDTEVRDNLLPVWIHWVF